MNIWKAVKYTPDAGFEGIDHFTYIASGFEAPRNVGTVYINVVQPLLGVDDWFYSRPGSSTQVLNVLRNEQANATQFQQFSKDGFPDGPLKIVSVTLPDHGGSARIADDGRTLIYSSSPNYLGVELLSYKFEDAGVQGEVEIAGLLAIPLAYYVVQANR